MNPILMHSIKARKLPKKNIVDVVDGVVDRCGVKVEIGWVEAVAAVTCWCCWLSRDLLLLNGSHAAGITLSQLTASINSVILSFSRNHAASKPETIYASESDDNEHLWRYETDLMAQRASGSSTALLNCLPPRGLENISVADTVHRVHIDVCAICPQNDQGQ